MCIIAYKPAGAKFPSKSTIKTMFRNNPDGAGFMYAAPDGVHIVKGLMSVSAFMQALSQIKHDTSIPVVMHFRIATHGGYSESMTQPFPLSNKNKRLRALNTICDVGIAHNGIIHMCNDAKKISDTAMFIRDYMTRLPQSKSRSMISTLTSLKPASGPGCSYSSALVTCIFSAPAGLKIMILSTRMTHILTGQNFTSHREKP